jgi:hypothetical protein
VKCLFGVDIMGENEQKLTKIPLIGEIMTMCYGKGGCPKE